MSIYLALSLLVCSVANAGQLSLSFGPSLDGTLGTKKALQLGYEVKWGAPFLEIEAGGWNEPNGASFMGSAMFGVHVTTQDGIFAQVGFGPAVVSQTDDRLSSLLEAHLRGRVGAEMGGWFVCGQYDHLSNAGAVGPNLGLDLIGLCVGIPLGGG
jgi:hypothetical protein